MRVWIFVLISLFRYSISSRNAFLLRPVWTANNRLNIPLVTQGTGRNALRGLMQVIFPVTLFLDSFFDEKMGTQKKRPKRGRKDFLRSYIKAETFGREENASIETCGFHYPKCPISLFNIFRSWSGSDAECEPIYSVDGVELQVSCDDDEESYDDDELSSVNLTVSSKWHE
ncbi:hypothetical protein QYM36_013887 [Artemia franciscana]|uniref:Uncharacterized protein n=1 Tax=Artemia franciscana TaxID=6661 RepID=A0AA88L501_ARTSF|nr:hypothetical protein QYM36_013887 [Artemia franciscana]